MEQVPHSLKRAIVVYFSVISLDSISFGIIAPILAPLLNHSTGFFSANFSPLLRAYLYGLLTALFPLAYMVGAPILGKLSDKFGRKRILLLCLVFNLFAYIAYIIAFSRHYISVLVLARLLAGLAAGSQGVAQAAIADFATKEQKPHAFSLIAVGMTMGLVVGPLAASLWSSSLTWLPFSLVLALSVLSIFLLWLYIPNTTHSSYKTTTTSAWRNLLFQKQVWHLLAVFLLFELGWSLYYQSLPLWFSLHWNLDNQAIGLLSAYVGGALAMCLLFGTRLGLRVSSNNNLIKIGFILGIFAALLNIFFTSLIAFLLLALPVVVAVAFIYPCLITCLSELTHEQQGLLMGIADAFLALAFTVTGLFADLLIYLNWLLPLVITAILWAVGYTVYKKIARNSY